MYCYISVYYFFLYSYPELLKISIFIIPTSIRLFHTVIIVKLNFYYILPNIQYVFVNKGESQDDLSGTGVLALVFAWQNSTYCENFIFYLQGATVLHLIISSS